MSSNYPPGCSANTFGAPWNEVEKEIEFCINVRGIISIDKPVNKLYELEILHDVKEEVRKELLSRLNDIYPEYEFT